MSKENTLESFNGFVADAADFAMFQNPGQETPENVIVNPIVPGASPETPKVGEGQAKEGDDAPVKELTQEEKDLVVQEQKLADDLFSKDEDDDDLGLGDDLTPNKEEILKADKKPSAAKLSNLQTLEFLKERGLVDYTVEDGKNLTEDEAEALIDDSYDNAIMAGIEDTIKDLPDVVKALVNTAISGGDINKILATLSKTASAGLTETLDMTVEDNQILAVTESLKAQGHDAEYIETNIQFLKDSGKLEGIAKKSFDTFLAKRNETIASVAVAAKQKENEDKNRERQYKATITNEIAATKDYNGLPITAKDAKTLPAFMTDRTVELQNGAVITPMQEAYFNALRDPKKAIALAKLLQSDFDFSSIAQSGATQTARATRQTVQETGANNKGLPTGTQGSSRKTAKSLAEMLSASDAE